MPLVMAQCWIISHLSGAFFRVLSKWAGPAGPVNSVDGMGYKASLDLPLKF